MAECITSALAEDLLAQVLQRLDVQERMGACSLVVSAWNRAVKRTFSSVTCKLDTSTQYQSLSSWLNSNNSISCITHMEVGYKHYYRSSDIAELPILDLPCLQLSGLQTMKLQCCLLRPATTSAATISSTGQHAAPLVSLAALTALSHLELNMCYYDVYELSSCTQLQHLGMTLLSYADGRIPALDGSMQALETVLSATLPQLHHLTSLSVDRCYQCHKIGELRFAPISAALGKLQQLQVLQIGWNVDVQESSLAHLPVSLHTLQISNIWYSLSAVSAPHLEQLTNLQQLQLSQVLMEDPFALLCCTQLTHLKLQRLRVPYRNASLLELEEDPSPEVMEAINAPFLELLAVLAELKQLKHLDLHECPLMSQPQQSADEPYAAITASSQLTYLDLTGCYMKRSAAWQIFVPGRCNDLVNLLVCPALLESPGSCGLLVSCCPALQSLTVSGYHGAINREGLTALQTLTALSKVHFADGGNTDGVLQKIARCQQLKDLVMYTVRQESTLAGCSALLHLTQLTSLTSLSFAVSLEGEIKEFSACNQAAADLPSDIPKQLLDHLMQQYSREMAEIDGSPAAECRKLL